MNKSVELTHDIKNGELKVMISINKDTTERYLAWSRSLTTALHKEDVEVAPSVEFRVEFCPLGNSLKIFHEDQVFVVVDEFKDSFG